MIRGIALCGIKIRSVFFHNRNAHIALQNIINTGEVRKR